MTSKICVNQPFMLPVKLLVHSRVLAAVFWGHQKFYLDFQLCEGVSAPNACIVQGSTVFPTSLTLQVSFKSSSLFFGGKIKDKRDASFII